MFAGAHRRGQSVFNLVVAPDVGQDLSRQIAPGQVLAYVKDENALVVAAGLIVQNLVDHDARAEHRLVRCPGW